MTSGLPITLHEENLFSFTGKTQLSDEAQTNCFIFGSDNLHYFIILSIANLF